MRTTPDYNLGKLHPELARQWQATKNGDLTPYAVMPKSGKKVWWICQHGHEWLARIADRSNGSGCPQCYNENRSEIITRAKLKIRGSLFDRNPLLSKEWHQTKNQDLTPRDVTPGSHKKVWWKCRHNHEWRETIHNRTQGTGCPFCSGRRPSKDYNLAVTFPETAKEWHPTKNNNLSPNKVTPGSHTKVWWICRYGHEWQATVNDRTNKRGGRNCPQCHPQTSDLEIRIYCELKTIFENAKWREMISGVECDVYLPKHKIGIEIDGYWHTDREEQDKAKQKYFQDKGIEIYRVRNQILSKITHSDVFYFEDEKHLPVFTRLLKSLKTNISLTDKDKLKISEYLVINKFQNRREYRKIISLLPGPLPEKSLAHLYPNLVNEWNYSKNEPLNPEMFFPGSHKKVWWTCSQGHEWYTQIKSRTRGTGCPYCSGNKAGKENNLAVKNPKLAQEWHPVKNRGLYPKDVTPKSSRRVWWKCSKGHEWIATVYDRDRTRGYKCPYCSRRRAGEDYNLAVKFPNVAKQWHLTKNLDVTPYSVTPKSHRKVWWKCSQGHEWIARIADRTRGRGCPECYNKRRSMRQHS